MTGSLTRSTLVRVAAIIVTGILISQTGVAQTPSDEAKDHYRKGTAAYNLGKYAEAAQEYELSYRASLDPALLFNVAQAYRLAGDKKKAVTAYKSYLRSAPNGDKRELAEARVREIEAALNYDDPFSGGSGAPASKPAQAPAPAPEPTPVYHPPGMEAVPPAPTAPLLVTETSASQPQPPPSEPLHRRWPFWAAVGVVAVAVVLVIVAESGSSSPPVPTTTYGTMRF
jgi:hypothetical protein